MSSLATPTDKPPLTVEQYFAFTDTRPNGEKWELIEGRAVRSPGEAITHQQILTNFAMIFGTVARQLGDKWFPLFGVGTRVPISEYSLPQPDFMVKGKPPTGSQLSEEALAIFEVLSECNTEADRAWRRKVYASVPNCRHYVTVSAEEVEVVAYDRSSAWRARSAQSLANNVDLPALGVGMPLREVYRWTPFAEARA